MTEGMVVVILSIAKNLTHTCSRTAAHPNGLLSREILPPRCARRQNDKMRVCCAVPRYDKGVVVVRMTKQGCIVITSSYFTKMNSQGWHTYYIYILTNKNRTVLYTGVTNNLAKRLYQHRSDIKNNKKTFVARYKCAHLIYYEKFTWIQEAIAREKEIKGWLRVKKLRLIQAQNPNLDFLEGLFPYDP